MNLDRRTFLQLLATAPWLATANAAANAPARTAARTARKVRKVIVVWLDGGLSHLDSFDGKPDAPPDVRGDVPIVRADVDGVFLGEPLRRLATRMRRCALVRSISHGEGNHDRGTHLLLTGHRPSPVLVHPSIWSATALDAPPDATLPPYVVVPDVPDYGGAGFLPAACEPFATGGEPHRADFRVPNLAAGAGNERIDELVRTLDELDGAPRSQAEVDRDRLRRRAAALSSQPQMREVFDVRREPAARRQQFGAHKLGQSCLLALRLAKAGVGTVLVRDTGWDHHVGIHRALTYGFPPKLTQIDEAISALLDALRDDGLEDDVTVCLASEFGRTPRLNPAGGRDHWPRAQSVLLFGGGVRAGVVVGATDARGEEPATDAVTPADLCATLLTLRGADLTRVLSTSDGRPVRLVAEGATPIAGVLRDA